MQRDQPVSIQSASQSYRGGWAPHLTSPPALTPQVFPSGGRASPEPRGPRHSSATRSSAPRSARSDLRLCVHAADAAEASQLLSMRGVVATVTSCIGGKDEKFAVQVRPQAPRPQYFVYKTMGDFDALWARLEALAADVKRQQQLDHKVSLLAKWLASVVDHYAFRSVVAELRAQDKDAMSALNVFLQFLVRRVSALYVESSILRCGCCHVARQLARLVRNFLEVEPPADSHKKPKTSPNTLGKRQFEELRPESAANDSGHAEPKPSMFPDRSPKAQKLCSVNEFCLPQVHKGALQSMGAAPLPSRRRVFAEVDF